MRHIADKKSKNTCGENRHPTGSSGKFILDEAVLTGPPRRDTRQGSRRASDRVATTSDAWRGLHKGDCRPAFLSADGPAPEYDETAANVPSSPQQQWHTLHRRRRPSETRPNHDIRQDTSTSLKAILRQGGSVASNSLLRDVSPSVQQRLKGQRPGGGRSDSGECNESSPRSLRTRTSTIKSSSHKNTHVWTDEERSLLHQLIAADYPMQLSNALEWDNSMATGSPEIDQSHRRLLKHSSMLHKGKANLVKLITELQAYFGFLEKQISKYQLPSENVRKKYHSLVMQDLGSVLRSRADNLSDAEILFVRTSIFKEVLQNAPPLVTQILEAASQQADPIANVKRFYRRDSTDTFLRRGESPFSNYFCDTRVEEPAQALTRIDEGKLAVIIVGEPKSPAANANESGPVLPMVCGNSAASELFNREPWDLAGRSLDTLFADENSKHDARSHLLNSGEGDPPIVVHVNTINASDTSDVSARCCLLFSRHIPDPTGAWRVANRDGIVLLELGGACHLSSVVLSSKIFEQITKAVDLCLATNSVFQMKRTT